MRRSSNNSDGRSRGGRRSSFRYQDERKGKRRIARESSFEPVRTVQTPHQIKAVERLLSGIGVPPAKPFEPDEFQLEALKAIETEDVLVTAPTGSGKTWI